MGRTIPSFRIALAIEKEDCRLQLPYKGSHDNYIVYLVGTHLSLCRVLWLVLWLMAWALLPSKFGAKLSNSVLS